MSSLQEMSKCPSEYSTGQTWGTWEVSLGSCVMYQIYRTVFIVSHWGSNEDIFSLFVWLSLSTDPINIWRSINLKARRSAPAISSRWRLWAVHKGERGSEVKTYVTYAACREILTFWTCLIPDRFVRVLSVVGQCFWRIFGLWSSSVKARHRWHRWHRCHSSTAFPLWLPADCSLGRRAAD